jgi:hypothetical protein
MFIIVALVSSLLAVTLYYHVLLKRCSLFTHFFYMPISAGFPLRLSDMLPENMPPLD